jgi:hypothetical protein
MSRLSWANIEMFGKNLPLRKTKMQENIETKLPFRQVNYFLSDK